MRTAVWVIQMETKWSELYFGAVSLIRAWVQISHIFAWKPKRRSPFCFPWALTAVLPKTMQYLTSNSWLFGWHPKNYQTTACLGQFLWPCCKKGSTLLWNLGSFTEAHEAQPSHQTNSRSGLQNKQLGNTTWNPGRSCVRNSATCL